MHWRTRRRLAVREACPRRTMHNAMHSSAMHLAARDHAGLLGQPACAKRASACVAPHLSTRAKYCYARPARHLRMQYVSRSAARKREPRTTLPPRKSSVHECGCDGVEAGAPTGSGSISSLRMQAAHTAERSAAHALLRALRVHRWCLPDLTISASVSMYTAQRIKADGARRCASAHPCPA